MPITFLVVELFIIKTLIGIIKKREIGNLKSGVSFQVSKHDVLRPLLL